MEHAQQGDRNRTRPTGPMHVETVPREQPHPAKEVHSRPEDGGPLSLFGRRFSLAVMRARGFRHRTPFVNTFSEKCHGSRDLAAWARRASTGAWTYRQLAGSKRE